mmetsp:Transcript_25609/g.25408  ORF Transcript_25609/g.25408 Transcript_25609/m.25408 type:complete len:105 (-) Transcript_25609:73-387(-)
MDTSKKFSCNFNIILKEFIVSLPHLTDYVRGHYLSQLTVGLRRGLTLSHHQAKVYEVFCNPSHSGIIINDKPMSYLMHKIWFDILDLFLKHAEEFSKAKALAAA